MTSLIQHLRAAVFEWRLERQALADFRRYLKSGGAAEPKSPIAAMLAVYLANFLQSDVVQMVFVRTTSQDAALAMVRDFDMERMERMHERPFMVISKQPIESDQTGDPATE